jgi:hypothetical protein
MNGKIDNLVKYFVNYFSSMSDVVKGTNFSRVLNKKTINLTEIEFKQQILKFSSDSNGLYWVNPVDILIMSIVSIEKISKQVNLKNCNKFTILWIMCLLNAKYVSSHDHENKLSLSFLSNLAGFQIEDYILFEKILLPKLDWRLEISKADYDRLNDISNGIIITDIKNDIIRNDIPCTC